MYDFIYGRQADILNDPEGFLIFCKRLLPRWLNGIPDSEMIAIWRSLHLTDTVSPCIIETGSGASSLPLCLFALLNEGMVFSWDTNGSKGSYLRSVISECMMGPLGGDINKVWKFVAYDSTDSQAGIACLSELGFRPSFGFFDSLHTLNHLLAEVHAFASVSSDQAIVAIDDAYYQSRYTNFAYLNMIRFKLGLPEVQEPADNVCDPFHAEVENFLATSYHDVERIADSYKEQYQSDIFFDYFSSDRRAMKSLGMEKSNKLKHRFDCWKVSRPRMQG